MTLQLEPVFMVLHPRIQTTADLVVLQYIFIAKKSVYKWTHAVQIHVQGPNVHNKKIYHFKHLKKNKFIYFIYLFLAALGLCCCTQAFSGCGEQGLLFIVVHGLLLLRITGSRHTDFSSYGTRGQQLWLTGSRAQAQQLWHTGLVAPQHVGSPWTRV